MDIDTFAYVAQCECECVSVFMRGRVCQVEMSVRSQILTLHSLSITGWSLFSIFFFALFHSVILLAMCVYLWFATMQHSLFCISFMVSSVSSFVSPVRLLNKMNKYGGGNWEIVTQTWFFNHILQENFCKLIWCVKVAYIIIGLLLVVPFTK